MGPVVVVQLGRVEARPDDVDFDPLDHTLPFRVFYSLSEVSRFLLIDDFTVPADRNSSQPVVPCRHDRRDFCFLQLLDSAVGLWLDFVLHDKEANELEVAFDVLSLAVLDLARVEVF